MAPTTNDATEVRNLDTLLLLHGFVSLYFRREVLEPDVRWLRRHDYDVRELDCSGWSTADAMHDALAATFAFPDYYGKNLAALNDCLSEVDVPSGKLAVVLVRFDVFAQSNRPLAQALLDQLADFGRGCLLSGARVITLAQSDDPTLVLDPVGATPVLWNRVEWLNASRGL